MYLACDQNIRNWCEKKSFFHNDKSQKISRPNGVGFDDFEGLKKKKQRIRGDRGWLATNPPMMKLVSIFQNMEFQTSGDCSRKNLPLFVGDKCLYRFMGVVIYLITSPIIKESRKFGFNFHNCYGSCIACPYFP